MSHKRVQESFAPFRALGGTSVILYIGRCPMLMALSPLGSKIGEFISIIVRYWIFAVCCLLLETNNSRMQNRASPPFLKEVAEVRGRRIREINPP